MRIAILGGTGDIGEGLALRWGYHADHELVIGSREASRAGTKADAYETELDSRGIDVTIEGRANADAAAGADAVVLAVPPYHVTDTVEAVASELVDADVVISPAAGMKRDETGVHAHPPSAGSVTELVAGAAPAEVPVVGAFHNLSAGRLADIDAELGIDTLLVGDDEGAKEIVGLLAEDIDGLRALDAGGLANAAEVESLTPLLLTVAQHNDGLHDLGVRFR
ncbi:NADPH-dependent F420 reductase [Halalkaliarchaeum desulfuricum]|uniref:NADPH-dependent F420 reductase n=1 Tax=Halalkaliarchaeum desulfuricum TaxID=2055893 RepID=A0A343TNH5_9EURY|nr:NADPH-dependent F420 reductase [Halalkaliarchaeum desulfuricum]AUX10647.1 NADPH-dependent F420 reductase [Halalkaliarchaeum desulfuricum]